MRRLTRADFESVPSRDAGWPALLITAAAFGAVHGALWGPGILAGASQYLAHWPSRPENSVRQWPLTCSPMRFLLHML